jgi:hypothetical protein
MTALVCQYIALIPLTLSEHNPDYHPSEGNPYFIYRWVPPIKKWCVENKIATPRIQEADQPDVGKLKLVFRSEEDATLFKLKWL